MPSHDLPRSLDALDGLFGFLEPLFDQNGLDGRTAFQLKLAAEELFTNLVRHNEGGGATIQVSAEFLADTVEIRFVDRGVPPFDPATVEEVDVLRPASDRDPGGLGLHLVKSIVDHLTYDYDNGEMTVTLYKRREPGC